MKPYKELRYSQCLKELRELIPADEYNKVMQQDECELAEDFLGFVDVYKSVSLMVPRGFTVIDFGCYLAAQSYFFKDHMQYIGVDVVKMRRFAPPNAVHFVGSIQEFIGSAIFELGDLSLCFAICSYVPDKRAVELVRRTFPNVMCYYPAGGPGAKCVLNRNERGGEDEKAR